MGSLLEEGSHPILSPQIGVLGKVLLLTLAAARSTPTELCAKRNRFPPLVPNWPHVEVFFLLLTGYYKVSGVSAVTPFAQRKIWQNRIFLEMAGKGGCRPRPHSCAANLEMDVTIHCPPFFAHPASSAQESSPL